MLIIGGATDAHIGATKTRLTYTTDLAAAVAQADLVIEVVPEIPDVKTTVYKEMAELLLPDSLMATNSSTLRPSDFAAATGRPEKFCALHFANLIWANNYAEIMAHPKTSRETLTEVTEFAIEIGMVPIPVLKEHNGYVANSWVVPLLNGAQTLVTSGIAIPEDVDRTFMVIGAPVGPLGLIDMVGMNTAYNVLSHWGRENGDAQDERQRRLSQRTSSTGATSACRPARATTSTPTPPSNVQGSSTSLTSPSCHTSCRSSRLNSTPPQRRRKPK